MGNSKSAKVSSYPAILSAAEYRCPHASLTNLSRRNKSQKIIGLNGQKLARRLLWTWFYFDLGCFSRTAFALNSFGGNFNILGATTSSP